MAWPPPGHSLATTRALTGAGARVVVPARRPQVARQALDGTDGVEIAELDLADLASTRRFADQVVRTHAAIDLIVANAGVMACPERRVGPGWELQFATNHLGHFALVNWLLPVLNPVGARVVMVFSGAHRITGIRWDDIHFTRDTYDPWQAYGQSKTANVLFATRLSALGHDRGILTYSVHPGFIITPLQRHTPSSEQIELGWIDDEGQPAPTFKTPAQGAATIVWAATSPVLADRTGVYCEDCDVAPVAANGDGPGVAPRAVDPGEAQRLWTYSARVTDLESSELASRNSAESGQPRADGVEYPEKSQGRRGFVHPCVRVVLFVRSGPCSRCWSRRSPRRGRTSCCSPSRCSTRSCPSCRRRRW